MHQEVEKPRHCQCLQRAASQPGCRPVETLLVTSPKTQVLEQDNQVTSRNTTRKQTRGNTACHFTEETGPEARQLGDEPQHNLEADPWTLCSCLHRRYRFQFLGQPTWLSLWIASHLLLEKERDDHNTKHPFKRFLTRTSEKPHLQKNVRVVTSMSGVFRNHAAEKSPATTKGVPGQVKAVPRDGAPGSTTARPDLVYGCLGRCPRDKVDGVD